MWDFLGGLVGGIGDVLGASMNTSSQQSINAANLQQQMAIASGAQLPQLVQNANRAGLNPLAVLGQSAPGGMAAVGTSPGAGVSAAGRDIGAHLDPRADQLVDTQLEKARLDVANARTAGNNAAIAGARDMWTLEAMQHYLQTHPEAPPPGIEQPTLTSMGAGWLNNLNQGVSSAARDIRGVFSRVPQSMWNTP